MAVALFEAPGTPGNAQEPSGSVAAPSAHVVTLNPAVAELMLSRNSKNRSLRAKTVEDYARDMKAGTWFLNGEAIKVDTAGNILDGQHRLHAIVKAGIPVTTFVVGGLPAETQSTMDSGMRRTTADALALADEQNATTVAAVIRRVWAWQQGDRKFNRRIGPTVTESKALLEQHPEIRRAADVASRTRAAFPLLPQSALGTAHFLMHAIDAEQCDRFFEQLASGTDLSAGHPVLALRNRVTADRSKASATPWAQQLSYIVYAWNAVRSERQISRLSIRPDAPVPTPK
ncbi:hypothetical protein ACGFYQ_34015 [Streptomyces sp. NPDC048258]|uniref:hypothetical protein n=1 Tax=Streptomyces sp. NPDC048258 TaxID=3365527 RepID=UPI00371F6615